MARTKRSLPKEVFLSHSSQNHVFVDRLAGVLGNHGIPAWFSGTNLVGAMQWHDEIGKALARCDWFAVVLSPHSVKSHWVKLELVYALNDKRFASRIIPILYRPCNPVNLSWTFQAVQAVDFTGDFPSGCRDLLRIWDLTFQEIP